MSVELNKAKKVQKIYNPSWSLQAVHNRGVLAVI